MFGFSNGEMGIGEGWVNNYVCYEDISLHALVLNTVIIVRFFRQFTNRLCCSSFN